MYRISNNQNSSNSQEDLLAKAFQLAFFINPNKDIALEITSNAFEMWEVICERQDKRRYYSLKGRILGNKERKKRRTKVNMQEEQLLQRLIYKISEEYELDQNWCKTIDEEGLLICYLKRLLSIILKNNSFSTIVGISRVLHKYTNKETVELYMSLSPNRATQDIANIERESKRYKSKLVNQLKDSFNGLISLSKNENEERFTIVKDSNKFNFLFNIVEDSLNRFKPWATECINSFNDFIFNDDNPDNEYAIELRRIHSVIHYNCYTYLTKTLNLDFPKERLEIPLFSLAENINNKNNIDRRNPPNAMAELNAIPKKLEDFAKRRKNFLAGTLSIIVDGKEKALLNLIKENHAHIKISEDSELVEIRNKKDNLLLATHLITEELLINKAKTEIYSIKLEGGQVIQLDLIFGENLSKNDERSIFINVKYIETNLIKKFSLFCKRFIYKIIDFRHLNFQPISALQMFISVLIIVAIIGSLYFYFRKNISTSKQDSIVIKQDTVPSPTITPQNQKLIISPAEEKKAVVKEKLTPKQSNKNRGSIERALPAIPPDFTERGKASVKNLSLVSKIYIKIEEDQEQIQKDIEIFIKENSSLEIVKTRIEADAILQYSSNKKTFLLLNKEANILWQQKLVINKSTPKENINDCIRNLINKISENTNHKQNQ